MKQVEQPLVPNPPPAHLFYDQATTARRHLSDLGFGCSLVLGCWCLVLLPTGCAVGPNYKRPQTPVANSFANAPRNVVSPDDLALETWWKGFNDTKLDSLVERAITNNHDLRIATANLKEARA